MPAHSERSPFITRLWHALERADRALHDDPVAELEDRVMKLEAEIARLSRRSARSGQQTDC